MCVIIYLTIKNQFCVYLSLKVQKAKQKSIESSNVKLEFKTKTKENKKLCVWFVDHLSSLKECCYDGYSYIVMLNKNLLIVTSN